MMNILLIGLGNMGKNHLRVLKKLTVTTECVIKTCDYDTEKKADYLNANNAIDDFKPTHVIIATNTKTHREILDNCIKKNVRYVLVEKPLVDVGETSMYNDGNLKTKILVGHIERFNPMVLKLQHFLQNKKIDTIICTRSGLNTEKEDYNVDTDLCIHDIDVCQFLTRKISDEVGFRHKKIGKTIKPNSANIFVEINGVDCFLHADKKSPYKRRNIEVMGPGYFVEGDYVSQKLWVNGEENHSTIREPLKAELYAFIHNEYDIKDLREAINNLEILKE